VRSKNLSDKEVPNNPFSSLLTSLDSNPEEAGRKYVKIHQKLTAFYDFKGCQDPGSLADQTLNRVQQKLTGNVVVENIEAYIMGFRKYVLSEHKQKTQTSYIPFDDVDESRIGFNRQRGISEAEAESDQDLRLKCLEKCLAELSAESRKLVSDYYEYDQGKKIEWHKQVAEKWRLTSNALRVRVHRIRTDLDKCMTKCMALHHA
jgi:hypothetical protein